MQVCNHDRVVLAAICLWLGFAGCGRSDTPGAGQTKPGSSPAGTSAAQAGAKGLKGESPEWIAASQNWPDTLRWVFDSAGEHLQDGLLMRFEVTAAQNMIPGQFADTKPLQCLLHMTLRPIPQWPLARGLVIDSVVFRDPLRQQVFPGLPMTPAERAYESQTMHTTFATIMKKPYTPTVTEGQPLEPTIFFHWDKRQIIGTFPRIPVSFLRTEAE